MIIEAGKRQVQEGVNIEVRCNGKRIPDVVRVDVRLGLVHSLRRGEDGRLLRRADTVRTQQHRGHVEVYISTQKPRHD